MIRQMDPSDTIAYHALLTEAGLDENYSGGRGDYARSPDETRYQLHSQVNQVLLGGFYQGHLAGAVGLGWIGRRGRLFGLFVLPCHRRRGLGQKLVEAVWQSASTAGLQRLDLEVIPGNTSAIALYQSCGYQVQTTTSASVCMSLEVRAR